MDFEYYLTHKENVWLTRIYHRIYHKVVRVRGKDEINGGNVAKTDGFSTGEFICLSKIGNDA